MRISLDYDDTYTRDPGLWSDFVIDALEHGHDIRFVTFRSDNGNNQDIVESCKYLQIPVLFTGGQTKRKYCYEHDFVVDVWIDDMPEIIVAHKDTGNIPVNLIKKVITDIEL